MPKRPCGGVAPSMIVAIVTGMSWDSICAAAMMSPMYASISPATKAASRSAADWNVMISTSVRPASVNSAVLLGSPQRQRVLGGERAYPHGNGVDRDVFFRILGSARTTRHG